SRSPEPRARRGRAPLDSVLRSIDEVIALQFLTAFPVASWRPGRPRRKAPSAGHAPAVARPKVRPQSARESSPPAGDLRVAGETLAGLTARYQGLFVPNPHP